MEAIPQSGGDIPPNPAYESLIDDKIRLLRAWGMEWRSTLLAAPAGIVCDGASVPKIFWTTIGHPLSEPLIRAAIIHDTAQQGALWGRNLIYLAGAAADQIAERLRPVWCPPATADAVFRDHLRALRVPQWRVQACFIAVRIYYACIGRRRYCTDAQWRERRAVAAEMAGGRAPIYAHSGPFCFDVREDLC